MNFLEGIFRFEENAFACSLCKHPILMHEHIVSPLFDDIIPEVLGIVAKTDNLVRFFLLL